MRRREPLAGLTWKKPFYWWKRLKGDIWFAEKSEGGRGKSKHLIGRSQPGNVKKTFHWLKCLDVIKKRFHWLTVMARRCKSAIHWLKCWRVIVRRQFIGWSADPKLQEGNSLAEVLTPNCKKTIHWLKCPGSDEGGKISLAENYWKLTLYKLALAGIPLLARDFNQLNCASVFIRNMKKAFRRRNGILRQD